MNPGWPKQAAGILVYPKPQRRFEFFCYLLRPGVVATEVIFIALGDARRHLRLRQIFR